MVFAIISQLLLEGVYVSGIVFFACVNVYSVFWRFVSL